MYLKDVEILENVEIKSQHYLLTFRDEEIAAHSGMGQFVELKAGGLDNLLRIPISICRVSGDRVSLLYRVVGNGTAAMAALHSGEQISVLGPLGHGFPDAIPADKEVLLVAGGIGLGPFPYVMDALPNWALFYGVRDVSELLLDELLGECVQPDRLHIATDNGSYGHKGYVTDLLDQYLTQNSQNKVVFCCGPNPMMRRVCEVVAKHGVESYISMEDYMGCGIGICVGCVRKIRDASKPDGWEHKKVCKDGPVFKGEDILWD